ncbi:MAG: hypothetical protein K1X71_12620 [Pirellulales bacterium]|nr:hypothetical protein [Pirellulales bacterium]
MPKFSKAGIPALLMVAVLVAVGESARAALISFETGGGNTTSLNGTLGGSGSVTITGASPLAGKLFGLDAKLVPNPQVTPVGFNPDVINIVSQPKSVGVTNIGEPFGPNITNIEISAPGGGHNILSLNNADLDLLNGTNVSVPLDTITLKLVLVLPGGIENPQDLVIDIKGNMTELYTKQIGAATFNTTGVGEGTFSIPSALHGFLLADISLSGIAADTDLELDTNVDITGDYKVELLGTGPPGNARVTLSGSQNIALPLNYFTAVATSIPGIAEITATLDLAASINMALSYSLQGTVVIPEPGSVVLLGIGLATVLPLVGRRVLRKKG